MGDVKWSAELEVALFHSMHGHKPVGETSPTTNPGLHWVAGLSLHWVAGLSLHWVAGLSLHYACSPLCPGLNKYFHMACIQWRLQRLHSITLNTQQLWQHLHSLYDLGTLVSMTSDPSAQCWASKRTSLLRTVLRSFHSQMRRGSSTCLTACWSASSVSCHGTCNTA